MAKDFYDILGLKDTASAAEIKKAFRTLAKKHHPDRNKGDASAEARFKEISEAYETLSDEKKRREYDTMRKYGAFAGPGAGGFANAGGFQNAHFDFNDLFGGGQRGGRSSFRVNGQDFGGFEDILSQMFGGRTGGSPFGQADPRNRQGVKRGPDAHTSVHISFMESVYGTERMIQLRERGKKLSVKIPAGIENGGKIRLRGQGHMGEYGGNNGDLIITVNVMPDQHFERKGNDIFTKVEIGFNEAILGCKKEIKTLTKTISLTIPPGTQPGAKLRLKGLGLAVGDQTGDQYVEVHVRIPKNITAKQRELLEQWGE